MNSLHAVSVDEEIQKLYHNVSEVIKHSDGLIIIRELFNKFSNKHPNAWEKIKDDLIDIVLDSVR